MITILTKKKEKVGTIPTLATPTLATRHNDYYSKKFQFLLGCGQLLARSFRFFLTKGIAVHTTQVSNHLLVTYCLVLYCNQQALNFRSEDPTNRVGLFKNNYKLFSLVVLI